MSNQESPDRLSTGMGMILTLLVSAIAFTFVTVWLLIFLSSPWTKPQGEKGQESRYFYSDVSKSQTLLPKSSDTSVHTPSPKEMYSREWLQA
jgi:hypothetical protein